MPEDLFKLVDSASEYVVRCYVIVICTCKFALQDPFE